MPIPPRKTFASTHHSPSTYAFHGSNSSHSKDSGAGGRTYHMPNYATSYANEKSNLITIHLEEDKGVKRTMFSVVLVLIFIGLPMLSLSRPWQMIYEFANPSLPHQMTHAIQEPTQDSTTRSVETCSPRTNESCNPSEEGQLPRHQGLQIDWNVYWDEPKPAEQCSSFGTREYSARLWNLSFFSNWKAACEATPIEIHGQRFRRPDRCENKWPLGGIVGYWKVKGEGRCSPQWGKYEDKESIGCIVKGLRLVRSRLKGIKGPDDWKAICTSAPAIVRGVKFEQPKTCEYGGWFFGIYGQWEIDDPKC